ncbi:MAG: DUF805 domain-containing protein [Rickettsiaceae bacterium]
MFTRPITKAHNSKIKCNLIPVTGLNTNYTFIPIIGVTVRRLHDCNLSGEYLFLYIIIFSILYVCFLIYSRKELATLVFGCLATFTHLLFIFIPGTDGPNKGGNPST